MKVLVYADSAIFSGAESLLCEIVTGLAEESDVELAFVAPSANRKLVTSLSEATGSDPQAAVPAQALPLAALHLYDPRRLRAIGKVLDEVQADVIFLNLPSAEYGSTPLLAPRFPATPVLGLMHISGTMSGLDFRLGVLRTMLARRAVSKLDSVCLLSEQAMRQYPEQWSPRGTELNVMRMPVPRIARVERGAARRSLGLSRDGTVIGMAARMTVKQKGQDTLVAAAPALLAERPDLKFVIAGEGQDRPEVEKLIRRLGVEESFILPGHVSDMGEFLSAIDLVAIPSRFEGLPLIGLEALAAGVPGVASSVDGLCDLWPEDWRVEPGNSGQLAAAISRLLDAGTTVQQDLVASGRASMEQLTSTNPAGEVCRCLRRAADRG